MPVAFYEDSPFFLHTERPVSCLRGAGFFASAVGQGGSDGVRILTLAIAMLRAGKIISV